MDSDTKNTKSSTGEIKLCRDKELDLRKTFECGQCFRWNNAAHTDNRHEEAVSGDVRYIGVAHKNIIDLRTHDGAVYIHRIHPQNTSHIADYDILFNYFSLDEDYIKIQDNIADFSQKNGDKFMVDAAKYCSGLRILRQDPFEALISFIISANNNIPKIKLSIEDMCARFGKSLGEYGGKAYHAFPAPEALASRPDEIENIRAIGYRARAVREAAAKVLSGELILEELTPKYSTFKDSVKTLRTLYGIGEKVANCVALFGLGHMDAFPVDTWIKKALTSQYGIEKDFEKFAAEHFKVHPGIAQQYMFFYLREQNFKK